MRSSFMINAGRFLFRYRSLIFPAIFISMLFVFRPRVYLAPPAYHAVLVAGFIITMLGEGLRVMTIGLDYIERGGKNKQPFASRLVTGGIYNHVRNPMYVGNLLIALGIALYSGAPLVMVTILPFFVWVYYAIVAAEEHFLREKFGEEYEAYCRRVNRFWPSFLGVGTQFENFTFNWKRPLEKDNGTAFYTFLALALLPVWRNIFLYGEASRHTVSIAIVLAALLVPSYAVIRYMAKTGKLATA